MSSSPAGYVFRPYHEDIKLSGMNVEQKCKARKGRIIPF